MLGLTPVRRRSDDWETPDAVVNDDGGLSAPLVYASLMLGMITVWKRNEKAEIGGDATGAEQDTGGNAVPSKAEWSEQVGCVPASLACYDARYGRAVFGAELRAETV